MNVYEFFIISTLFISCRSEFVDNLEKCNLKDEACVKVFHEKLWAQISGNGIESLGIVPTDPFRLENVEIKLFDALTVTVVGTVKGLKDCSISYFYSDLEKKTDKLGLICDVTISGLFHIMGSSQVTEQLLHKKTVDGEGNELIKIEKLHINVTYTKYPVERDGVIYMHLNSKGIDYTFSAEKFSITADHFLIGNDDISQLVVSYVKSNWVSIFENIGGKFIDPILALYCKDLEKFYSAISANKFIIDDLSSFVVKE